MLVCERREPRRVETVSRRVLHVADAHDLRAPVDQGRDVLEGEPLRLCPSLDEPHLGARVFRDAKPRIRRARKLEVDGHDVVAPAGPQEPRDLAERQRGARRDGDLVRLRADEPRRRRARSLEDGDLGFLVEGDRSAHGDVAVEFLGLLLHGRRHEPDRRGVQVRELGKRGKIVTRNERAHGEKLGNAPSGIGSSTDLGKLAYASRPVVVSSSTPASYLRASSETG